MLSITQTFGIASIQDLGREGYLSLGIGRCGAMDRWSYRLGNALLGNPNNAPALELALGGLVGKFDKDITFCLTGANFEATLDNHRLATGYRYFAKAGQVLTLKRMTQGMYGYLCVQGGFEFRPELGSVSTDSKTGLGGLGRPLKAGDKLPYQTGESLSEMGAPYLYHHEEITHIHVIKSSEYDLIVNDTAQDKFDRQNYTLSPNSNRMGYRLEGEPLVFDPIEMPSHGVEFGMIQVPPDGKPIVLMADAQTTGGYPKIASVIEADLGKLAQVRLGGRVRFCYIDCHEAIQKMHALEQRLAHIAWMAQKF